MSREDCDGIVNIQPDEMIQPICIKYDKYPYCIVWTTLPLLSWIFPFIGHVGICDSEGVIFDFAGSYNINRGSLIFGNVMKYFQLDIGKFKSISCTYNNAIEQSNNEFKYKMHNLITSNCHDHVCSVLNRIQFKSLGFSHWNSINLILLLLMHSKYVSWLSIIKTWSPFFIINIIIICALCIKFN